MNSTFKISALAVLVSVGLTACHGGYKDKSPVQSTPTVINKQDNIKKPTQPEKKAEQPKPEVKPESKITQKGKGVTTDELPTVHFKNGTGVTTPDLPEAKLTSIINTPSLIKPEQPKPEIKPEQPKPEVKPEQPKPEVKPEQPKPEVKPEQPKPEVKPEQPKPEIKPNYENVVTIDNSLSSIDELEVDKLDWRYYGPRKGSFWIDTKEMSNGNQKGIFKGEVDSWNYMMVNQPYSNYGFLSEPGLFGGGVLGIGSGAHTGFEPHATFKESYIIGKINNGIKEINPELHGSATYRGPVIRVDNTSLSKSLSKDGSVTLNANFAKTLDKSSIQGEIDSLSVGKITFEQTDFTQTQPGINSLVDTHKIFYPNGKGIGDNLGFHGESTLGDKIGVYQGTFHGPKLDDVKGTVSFGHSGYNAVFGGTKQPK